MFDIFTKRKKNTLTDLMVVYINSMLPSGTICRESLTDKDTRKSILVYSDTSALSFDFDFEENYDVDKLSEGDKDYLIQHIIVPALKSLDKDLFEIHKQIEAKLNELDG